MAGASVVLSQFGVLLVLCQMKTCLQSLNSLFPGQQEGLVISLSSFLHKNGLICAATSNQHFLLYTATGVSQQQMHIRAAQTVLQDPSQRAFRASWPSFLGTRGSCGLSTSTQGYKRLWAPGSGQQRTQPVCLPSGDPQQGAVFSGIRDSLHSSSGSDEKEVTQDVAFMVGQGLMAGG